MTTDKTPATLATVKNGGCVQLGDGLPPLPEAWYRPNSPNAPIGQILFSEDQMRDYARAALSAQPFLGGQRDARIPLATPGKGEWSKGWNACRDAMLRGEGEALAVRQPVGNEPAFYLSAGAWGHIRVPMTPTRDVKAFRHGFDHGDTELVPFYAAPPVHQPAQAVDLVMQQDAARWRAIAPHLSVEWDEDEMLKRWTWIDFKGDALSVPTRTRESYASVEEAIDAVIDSKAVQS